MRKAFTLIELLVVIAIIAILAAILFPVFAQAKESAKRTKALAQVKQIGTSLHMYAADMDDRFPSVYDGGDSNHITTLGPYVKSNGIWNANRSDTPTGSTVPYGDFGYNWGFEIRSGGGMVNGEQCMDGGDVSGCGGRGYHRYNAGKTVTEMTNPSQLFAFGDTYDTPRATIGGDGWILDKFTGTRNSALRYGGKFNIAYADSHANNVIYKAGTMPSGAGFHGNKAASPKDFAKRVNGYCADPQGSIRPFPRSGYPMGTMTCETFVASPEALGVTWFTD